MDKKELSVFYDCILKIRKECPDCPNGTICIEAEKQIRSLISSSGEAEAGDEEREKLVRHFQEHGLTGCFLCEKIIAILRQRRTVSREWIREWAVKFNDSVDIAITIENFTNSIRSIGVIVREEEKDGK